MVNMAMKVNKPADTLPMASPKLSNPIPREPRITVKLSHERKVLSLAKNTLGSTRAGKAIRLVWLDIVVCRDQRRVFEVSGVCILFVPRLRGANFLGARGGHPQIALLPHDTKTHCRGEFTSTWW